MVLTAVPAQAHAGWFTCESGSWQWSWSFWEWGCDCDSGWETTPSPWIDQCTTYTHPTCNGDRGQYDYICTFSSSDISSNLRCDEDDVNLESRCWHYEPWNTPFNFSSPGDDWYYKACPRTHICTDQQFNFTTSEYNPCFDMEFVTNSPADRPCGSGGITTY